MEFIQMSANYLFKLKLLTDKYDINTSGSFLKEDNISASHHCELKCQMRDIKKKLLS